MGIPGFPFSRDFRHPVVIIGTPFDCKQRERYEDAFSTDGTSQLSKHVRCRMAKYKVVNSGSKEHIPEEI